MYRVPSALAPAAFIPGLVYEALIRARNGMYSAGITVQKRLPAPVISIGNISMGGTGKTPLVIHVAHVVSTLGFTPAVLTRGYARIDSKEPRILGPGETTPKADSILGDEPALIRRRIPASWLGVQKDRFVAGSIIAKRDPRTVFVLDDGFQHRTLARDLDMVIVDSSRPLGSDRIFPRGTLREPVSALRRCDAIIINGTLDSPETRAIEAEIQELQPSARIFFCNQFIQRLTPLQSWQKEESGASEDSPPFPDPGNRLAAGEAAGMPSAYLVTALANPERFRRDVQRLGISRIGEKHFADHHRLTRKEWQYCVQQARQKGADAIITTEKDAVKIIEPPDYRLLVAEQTTEISDAIAFERILIKCIEGHPWRISTPATSGQY